MIQISDVLDLELASALSESVEVLAWEPQRSFLPGQTKPGDEDERRYQDPPGGVSAHDTLGSFRIRRLPLLRGFARRSLSWLARTGPSVAERLLAQTPDPEHSPLICSTPFFAPVAERWPGPVIYWLTDLIAEYESTNRNQVIELDRRMCRAATVVCPNSAPLARYLQNSAGCEADKICIVPNATRGANILHDPPRGPATRTSDLRSIQMPIAGVIGNLAENMDWRLLQRVVKLTPWLTWVFVGPTTMAIADPGARRARRAVMAHANTLFLGRKPYGALAQYARCFDVAVLPYSRRDPTSSGSSTRFYEHLAACRPMIASGALEELTHKQPLLTLVGNADEAVAALERLRAQNFDDGLLEVRWRASRHGTWQARAAAIQQALAERVPTAAAVFA